MKTNCKNKEMLGDLTTLSFEIIEIILTLLKLKLYHCMSIIFDIAFHWSQPRTPTRAGPHT